MMDTHPSPDSSRSPFPAHSEPRVWVITAGDSPIGISVARQILAHGDYALLGLGRSSLKPDEPLREAFSAFLVEVDEHSEEGWGQRLKTVPLDIRCGGDLEYALLNDNEHIFCFMTEAYVSSCMI